MGYKVEIIEKYILGKRKDQALNEDALVITENYVAVIDGASSAYPFNGVSGGLVARRILADGLERMEAVPDGLEVIRRLNGLLREAQRCNPEAETDPSKRIFASLIIYSVNEAQIWNYGDCPFTVNGVLHQFDKKVDTLNAEVRSFVNKAELAYGKTVEDILREDVGMNFIKPLLDYQNVFANKVCEFGYPILDGFGICEEYFECVDLSDGDEVVLATDGYPILRPTLAESEAELERLLSSDPLCIGENRAVKCRNKEHSSFDDRCYVRFRVGL